MDVVCVVLGCVEWRGVRGAYIVSKINGFVVQNP